jgi:hypothetical protein
MGKQKPTSKAAISSHELPKEGTVPKSSEKDGEKKNGAITIARITAVQAIFVALIGVIGSGLTGYFAYLVAARNDPDKKPSTVVPPPKDVKTVPKIGESGGEGILLLKDISIFDLRAWKEVPPSEANIRFSPVNYINYLHVKKTRPTNVYRAHYATSGVAIDLRCITHQANILLQATPIEHAGAKMKEYAVEVNVENVPVDQEFLIVNEGTYWNSFQDLQRESASTYTDTEIDQLDELALIVLLPESRPFKNYRLWYRPANSSNNEVYRELSKFYPDQAGRFLYWSITERKSDYHYTVTWDW